MLRFCLEEVDGAVAKGNVRELDASHFVSNGGAETTLRQDTAMNDLVTIGIGQN